MNSTDNKTNTTKNIVMKLVQNEKCISSSDSSISDLISTIHVLEAQQLEMQLQIKSLRLVKEQAENSAQKYAELYDFAPSAYFTISYSGKIIDSNIIGYQILGKNNMQLNDRLFINFVCDDSIPIFNTFLQHIFIDKNITTCELKLKVSDNAPILVQLTGKLANNSENCLITVMNIAEIKKSAELNETLLASLPYPAMYIKRADRIVLDANKAALDMGVNIGGHCWREFGKTEHISAQFKRKISNYPNIVPSKYEVRCTFCQAEKCFSESTEQNNREIQALNKTWNTYWIKINEEVFLHYAIDITLEKQAIEEREFLMASIDNTNNIVVVKDLDLKVVAANKGFLDIIGKKFLREVVGKTDAEIFDVSPNSEPVRSYMRDDEQVQKLEKGDYILKEEFIILPNGDYREILTKKYPIFNGAGKVFCTGSVSLDITERKKGEAALHKRDQILKSILDQFPGEIFWKDKESKYLGCNELFVRGIGLKSRSEIVGKTDFDFLKDIKKAENYHAEDCEIIETGKQNLHKIEMKQHQNGEQSWFDSSKIPLRDTQGNIIGILGVFTDITDRKLAEDGLRKSEEKYRELIENSKDIVYILNSNGIFTFVSNAWTVLLGHPESEVVGKSYEEFVHPDDRKKCEEYVLKAILKEDRQDWVEYRVRNLYGEWKWHRSSGVAKKDKDGNIIHFEGIATDITERKIGELKLQESEKSYRYLFAHNPQPMWIIDFVTLAFLEVNTAAVNQYGYSVEEFKTMKLTNIQLHKNSIAPHKKLNKDKQAYHLSLEAKHKTKTGKIILVEITSHAVNYDGRNARHILANDITERKLAEEKLKHLNEKLEDRVRERTAELSNSNISLKLAEEKFRTVADFTYGWEYWINDVEEILYMSPSAEKLTGYTAQEFINDPKLLDKIVFENDRDNWESHKKSVYFIKKKKRHAEIIYRIVKKNGDVRWISSVCRSVAINGKYMGMRVSNLNVTQKVKAESELLKVTVNVEERERNRFSRELHDGMGPLLSTIKLYFQWLSETNDPEKIKIITQKGNANIESAIQSSREIARGLSTQNLKKFGYVDTITDFTERLNDTNKIKINFTSNTNERFDNFIETTLYRISTELIKNTITYAKATLVNINFNFNRAKKSIQFTYSDNGIGFDLLSTENNNKGMGVMNIQQRIKSLRGKFKLKSKIGNGMNVTIELPIDEV